MAEEATHQGDTPAPKMSKTKLKQTIWPEPLVVEPTAASHTHSIILLHGRGSNAERFGLELLAARTSAGRTLAEHLPTAHFIFPTAKKRRSTVLKRVPINQWLDNFSAEDPSRRQDLQYDGIRETSEFVRGLVGREAAAVGFGRVVIGGLSQGCAAALHVLLNSAQETPLAGFVGMSGWLPFAEALDPTVAGEEDEDGDGDDDLDDIFGPEDGDDDVHGAGRKGDEDERKGLAPLAELQRAAANTARDIASLPPLTAEQEVVFPSTPIFLGHGVHDEKISVNLGKQATHVLKSLGCKVLWRDYDEGHWYKVPEELDDIVDFLQDTIGI